MIDFKKLIKDNLSEMIKDSFRNDRRDIWLWLTLKEEFNANLDPAACNTPRMREDIYEFLSKHPSDLETIRRDIYTAIIPEENFSWMKEEKRQILWLTPRIEDLTQTDSRRFARGSVNLFGREKLIAIIDFWEHPLPRKVELVERLHSEWRRHESHDTDYRWFSDSKEGLQRCICAGEWFEKESKQRLIKPEPIRNYEELLIHFDNDNYERPYRKEIIKKIQASWNKRKFEERNPDKQQLNVRISKKAKDLLNELSGNDKKSQSKIIEKLILMEAEHHIYLRDM
ncbi:hypothetical protein [Pseudomonas citronellolis]|uniref:hypothetical protein n=1 Tax=Pseudomonas citronellolis TaxID=53408 RepID=UPI0023E379C5|nr:hypothetical protein [Pseudomonas citronellolis]MDF3931922.1 hypothetical protein [Pseudomonas citronellolis]